MAFTKEDWWFNDGEGRRIGWLWPEDMESILESYFGERRWVNEFSKQFDFSRSTIDRWRDGSTPIPKHVAGMINMLGTMKTRGIPLSPIEASWLPEAQGANAKLPEDVEAVKLAN